MGERDIILTTFRNRAGVSPFYSQYAANVSVDRVVQNMAGADRSDIESYIDALSAAISREEFSMVEDIVGVDA